MEHFLNNNINNQYPIFYPEDILYNLEDECPYEYVNPDDGFSNLEIFKTNSDDDIIKWGLDNKYLYRKVNNDGGCQFYAFSEAYTKILDGKGITSKILNKIKYNQKKENTEEIRLHILNMCDKYIDGYNTDEKIRDEIDKLLDTKEWGNHYSLVLLSNHYNVNIIVYNFKTKDDVEKYEIKPKEKSNDIIKLIRINNNHYDYLIDLI